MIRAYCTCGAKVEISIDPKEREAEVHALWLEKLHSGSGHEPCNAETARKARTS